MEKKYIAAIVDEYGNEWWYENTIKGNDIFNRKDSGFCTPKMLSEAEAISIAKANAEAPDEAAIVLFEGV